MKEKKDIFDLLSLLKVFDVNYISNEDCAALQNLNPNDPADVSKAANTVLLREFCTYLPSAQKRLTDLLHSTLADSQEDFHALFERVEPSFNEKIINKRSFMTAILKSIESTSTNEQPKINP